MAPRYEAYVPSGREKEFETYVRNWLGGDPGVKTPDPRDSQGSLTTEWSRQIAEVTPLVDAFTMTHESVQVQLNINRGVISLVRQAFSSSSLKDTIDWHTVRQTLGRIFRESTPEQPPQGLIFGSRSDAKDTHLTYSTPTHQQNRFLPRQVKLLIKRYGLSGEQAKTIQEIAQEEKLSPSAVRAVLKTSLWRVRQHPQISTRVLGQ